LLFYPLPPRVTSDFHHQFVVVSPPFFFFFSCGNHPPLLTSSPGVQSFFFFGPQGAAPVFPSPFALYRPALPLPWPMSTAPLMKHFPVSFPYILTRFLSFCMKFDHSPFRQEELVVLLRYPSFRGIANFPPSYAQENFPFSFLRRHTTQARIRMISPSPEIFSLGSSRPFQVDLIPPSPLPFPPEVDVFFFLFKRSECRPSLIERRPLF